MKLARLIAVAAIGLSLAGCQNAQNVWTKLTSAQVNPTDVYIAEQVFNAVEKTAEHYLHYCSSVQPSSQVCKKEAIAGLIPAVRSGRVARVNLDTFMKTHPDALGAKGLYDALTAATNTLQSISTQYNIAGVQ